MGFLSKFEGKMEDTVEGAADKMGRSPISPVQIAKKAEKQMKREKMVGAGKQYAPTLYTVLVNADDDERLFGYYPTLAGETETYLAAKAAEQGLVMDGQPLVRFIVDDELKHGKFDVIAEAVAAPIIAQLRAEEMQRYGLAPEPQRAHRPQRPVRPAAGGYRPAPAPARYDEYDQDYDRYDGYGQQGYDDYEFGAAPAPAGVDRRTAFNDEPAGEADLLAAPAAAAGAGAAAAAPRQQRAANTVVFAGGQAAAEAAVAAASAQPEPARLIDTTNNRAYNLAASRLMVGRESKNDIVVSDINASRSHAELTCDPQGIWRITDLGSTNGTLVNGFQVASQELEEGDRITIGTTNFVFTYRG
ncbi:MAG: DUF3662 and FHA domain-containing protein [Eggerthellaceae bacterium]|nr:DUF3662 and FHA domain-containing protein [Eggerthellaceae bacterium]